MKKKLFFPLYSLLIFVFLSLICARLTGGFRLSHIASNLDSNTNWNLPDLTDQQQKELKPLLLQEFSYFDRGEQCYVFLGEDQTTIIKFFIHDHCAKWEEFLSSCLPFGGTLKKWFAWKQRDLLPVFASAKIAYVHLKDPSALLYLHVNKTEKKLPCITIKDKIGVEHTVDLNKTEFLLQKRADPFFEKLSLAIQEKDFSLAKQYIRSFLRLLSSRCSVGIENVDFSIKRNLAILHGEAVEIDIGSYKMNPHLTTASGRKQEILFHTKRLKRWMAKHSPELCDYLDAQILFWSRHQKTTCQDLEIDQSPL